MCSFNRFKGGWNSALSRSAIERLSTTCKDLRALSLTGCKGLLGESLLTITQSCLSLMKLDLSSVSVIHSTSRKPTALLTNFLCRQPYSPNPRGAISSSTLCEVAKVIGSRLTHLNLANNCTTGIHQIVAALAVSRRLAAIYWFMSDMLSFKLTLGILSELGGA